MSMDEMKRWWGVFHAARVEYGKSLDYPRQVSRECFCGPDMRPRWPVSFFASMSKNQPFHSLIQS